MSRVAALLSLAALALTACGAGTSAPAIIVLYPYAVAAAGPTPYNPNGCWDWWGYDDPTYAVKAGTQLSIVYRMVERVTGSP